MRICEEHPQRCLEQKEEENAREKKVEDDCRNPNQLVGKTGHHPAVEDGDREEHNCPSGRHPKPTSQRVGVQRFSMTRL